MNIKESYKRYSLIVCEQINVVADFKTQCLIADSEICIIY